MKKLYIKPFIKTISVTTKQIVCSSGYEIEVNSEVKKYGCPIMKDLDCRAYDKRMHEYEQWLKDLSTRQDSAIFHQGPDENYCPRKTCPIYLKWKNQQKTR